MRIPECNSTALKKCNASPAHFGLCFCICKYGDEVQTHAYSIIPLVQSFSAKTILNLRSQMCRKGAANEPKTSRKFDT